jgi:hypothetical protein
MDTGYMGKYLRTAPESKRTNSFAFENEAAKKITSKYEVKRGIP